MTVVEQPLKQRAANATTRMLNSDVFFMVIGVIYAGTRLRQRE